jgi:hypothetical protein
MEAANVRMAGPLQSILEAELARGNEVVEVAAWPPKCQLLVVLRSRFHQFYLPLAEVEFAVINDPHYWQAEYNYKGGQQTLACGFK